MKIYQEALSLCLGWGDPGSVELCLTTFHLPCDLLVQAFQNTNLINQLSKSKATSQLSGNLESGERDKGVHRLIKDIQSCVVQWEVL